MESVISSKRRTRWTPQAKCPPLISNTTVVACFFGGQEGSCSQPQKPGALAKLACKPGFTVNVSVLHRPQVHCTEAGKWDHPIYDCIPEKSSDVPTATCPPLIPNTTVVACFYGGQEGSCSQPQKPGALAKLACKPGLTVNVGDLHRAQIHCTEAGEWDHPVYDCIPGVAAFTLALRPDHVFVGPGPRTVTVVCTADVALTACQVTWLDDDGKAGPLLELSQGPQSQANSSHLYAGLTGYSYSGRGLGEGDCGVELQVKGLKYWMLGCRVRSAGGGWQYNWTDFVAHSWPHLPTTMTTPREVVVLPGEAVRFTVKAQEPLSHCLFNLPTVSGGINFNQGPQSEDSTGWHLYHGAGLESGECGLTLSNVSEANNGQAWSYERRRQTRSDEFRYHPVIVALRPSTISLHVSYEGANLRATCTVLDSRPVAQISWLVGDKVVRQDMVDDSPASSEDKWRWPWVAGSITQTLRRELQPEDQGQVLQCRVSHMTLATPLVALQPLSFTDPLPSTG